jgi:RimJ/RimL family protein N-acetyltransferase
MSRRPAAECLARMRAFDRRYDPRAGRYRSLVVDLEQRSPPADEPRLRAGLSIRRWPQPNAAEYLSLFHRVGDPWLWFGRLRLDPKTLSGLLANDRYHFHRLYRGDEVVGLLELDRRVAGEVEIGYFGLVPEATGHGLGGPFLAAAIAMAWEGDVRRVWLHTCSEDHPAALPSYLRAGFEPVAERVEWVDDPRCSGLLPPDAGPHVPMAAT